MVKSIKIWFKVQSDSILPYGNGIGFLLNNSAFIFYVVEDCYQYRLAKSIPEVIDVV